MIGQIVYKDGSTEPIFECREHNDYCEVVTPSGKYAYQPFVDVIDDYKYFKPAFYYYDNYDHRWWSDNSIKEFQINKES